MNKPLKGKFVKISNPDGTHNFDESLWEVSYKDELIMRKTVKQLCQMDSSLSYESIATREFGLKLLEKVRKNLVYW